MHHTPLKVFDAACGIGAPLRRLRAAGYIVAALDASENGIPIAQQTIRDDVRLKHLSVYDEFASSSGCDWNVVVATEGVEHLYAPHKFVRRVHALPRPGGTLVLSTPYHDYLKTRRWLQPKASKLKK